MAFNSADINAFKDIWYFATEKRRADEALTSS